MKKQYQEYISLALILIQMGLGYLDIISDIDYAVNSKKSSEEIKIAAIFCIVFQPFCQMISWTYIIIKIHIIEQQLEEKQKRTQCYYLNRIESADNFWNFLKYLIGFKLSELWSIIKLLKYLPLGIFYGLIQYFRVLHIYLFYNFKNNNQITQQYENLFIKRFKKYTKSLENKIYSSLRKEAIIRQRSKTQIAPMNSINRPSSLKEIDIENSQTSSLMQQEDNPSLLKSLTNQKSLKSKQIINVAEAQIEQKKQDQLQEEFTQEELYQIYRQTTFVQFLNNEKIAGMIQISEIIEFIFESMPQLLIQFINNGQLGLWSGNNSGTFIPPIINFILSLVSILLNSVHLINYLLQKESLNFILIQRLLSKEKQTPLEQKLIHIKDKLEPNITIISNDSLVKVAELRKQTQDTFQKLTIVLPLLKQTSNKIFMDISQISLTNIKSLKIDLQQIQIQFTVKPVQSGHYYFY